MPSRERTKTKYPGVYFVMSTGADGKPERVFYITYRRDGKLIEEKAGFQRKDDMSDARAARLRAERIDGKSVSNKTRRENERTAKEELTNRWTVNKIWEDYDAAHCHRACAKGDASYFKYIQPEIGTKTPAELVTLDLERLKRNVAKTKSERTGKLLSEQTVKHVLALLKRMLRWAAEMGHIEHPIHLKFKMPRLANEKTEFMSEEQLRAYLKALDEEIDQDKAAFFRVMLLTGVRRTALLNVRWDDVDLKNGYLVLRGEVAKNDKTQTLPLSPGAVQIFANIPRQLMAPGKRTLSPYVWPGKNGGPREDFRAMGRRLRDKAGLPKDWRPCHMLRHTYASILASSGVNIYELQKLLTHGSTAMTQRYAHLSNESLKRAAATADIILNNRESTTAANVEK